MDKNLREVLAFPIVQDDCFQWNVDELFRLLVAAHTVSAKQGIIKNCGTVHVCLSGGLDSSTSIGLMVCGGIRPEQIFAHTISISHHHADAVFAKKVAHHFGVACELIVPSTSDVDSMREHLYSSLGRVTLGEVGTHLLYAELAKANVKSVIAHDGIDELLGGYWDHRSSQTPRFTFEHFWARLNQDHLVPLQHASEMHGVEIEFPYLQKDVVEYITRIPFTNRTSRHESKIPLRQIARLVGVPVEVIMRQKIGFCDALVINERTDTRNSSET